MLSLWYIHDCLWFSSPNTNQHRHLVCPRVTAPLSVPEAFSWACLSLGLSSRYPLGEHSLQQLHSARKGFAGVLALGIMAFSVGRTHPDASRAAFAFSPGSMVLVVHSHPLMNYLTRIPQFKLLSPKLSAESLLLFPKQIILISEPQTSGNCFYLIWLCITGAYQHCVIS